MTKRRICNTGVAMIALIASAAVAAEKTQSEPQPAVSRQALRDRAIRIVIEAASGRDPALRSNAIEAMQPLPDRALPLTTRALTDENPGVRFAATVTAGMLKFRDLSSAIRPLLEDPNPSVRAAALFALHTLGEKVDITPLADMLASRDPALRSNTALLLGLLGDGSAVPLLKDAAQRPLPRASVAQATVVRLQIAEAIARLGDDSSLDALRAAVFSQYHEARVLAITSLGAIKDRSMEAALEGMLTRPDVDPVPSGAGAETQALADRLKTELQLSAAGALARAGNTSGSPLAVTKAASKEPVVRAQAAWVLGWMKDEASLAKLGHLMFDPVPQVRVAAAASVLRRVAAQP